MVSFSEVVNQGSFTWDMSPIIRADLWQTYLPQQLQIVVAIKSPVNHVMWNLVWLAILHGQCNKNIKCTSNYICIHHYMNMVMFCRLSLVVKWVMHGLIGSSQMYSTIFQRGRTNCLGMSLSFHCPFDVLGKNQQI